MAAYVGKYDRTSADKYDEFLSELGVNMLMRKAATASTPVFEVNNNSYVISVKWQHGRLIILCQSGACKHGRIYKRWRHIFRIFA